MVITIISMMIFSLIIMLRRTLSPKKGEFRKVWTIKAHKRYPHSLLPRRLSNQTFVEVDLIAKLVNIPFVATGMKIGFDYIYVIITKIENGLEQNIEVIVQHARNAKEDVEYLHVFKGNINNLGISMYTVGEHIIRIAVYDKEYSSNNFITDISVPDVNKNKYLFPPSIFEVHSFNILIPIKYRIV